MRTTRRGFLTGTVGVAMFAGLPKVPMALADGAPAFVACCRTAAGDYAAAVLDPDGSVLFTAALDERGHDAAVDPVRARAVVFARRPGEFAVVLDLVARRKVLAFTPPEDRLFAGHGAFTTDGRLMFATEEDFDGERGVMGIYDATDAFRRIGEIASYGIGPHEALLLSDGKTLAIANGGILTHPDFPRLNLNIATMEPSLALVDAATGDLLVKAALPAHQHQLSIRHLAEAADGSVWFGGQYEGGKGDRIALVGAFDMARGLTLIDAPDDVWRGMNQYVGSIAASRDGATVAATSPRGGTVLGFDVARRTLVRVTRRADAGGVAADGSGFVVSTGEGDLLLPGGRERHGDLAWDNHIRPLGGRKATRTATG